MLVKQMLIHIITVVLALKQLLMRIALIIAIAIGGFSCGKKFLETEPKSFTSKDNFFKTAQDYESALNGCYSSLQEAGYYGRNFPAIGELAADNAVMSSSASGLFADIHLWGQTPSDIFLRDFWKASYATVYRCNVLIENTEASMILTAEQKNRYKAHALSLRTLAHFDLFRVFAPRYDSDSLAVPFIDFVPDDSLNFQPGRPLGHTFYNSLMRDIKLSRRLFSSEDLGSSYFNASSAAALASKIEFYCRNYQQAILYADTVINSGKYSLLPSADYYMHWENGNSTESVFTVNFDVSNNPGTESLSFLYSDKGYKAFVPSDDLKNLFLAGDIRAPYYYGGHCSKFSAQATGTYANFPAIKLAEMHLIIAESAYYLNVQSVATFYLDVVRRIRNPGLLEFTGSSAELYKEIENEARREFAFEGHRFFDFKRKGTDINRGQCMENSCKLTYLDQRHKFTMPIPIAEINANANIIQNEKY
jgi:starch-binding outer membrane protein, SusD/RagB family